MSHRKISAALSTRLKSLPSSPPVAWENSGYTPKEDILYLVEDYLPAETVPVGLEDDSSDMYTGIYQVSVYAPADDFKLNAQKVAENVIAHFARGLELLYEGAQIRIENTNTAAAIQDSGWYMIPLSINWRSFQ